MKIACILVLAVASTTVAYADNLVTIRPAGTDSVNWAQLGPDYTIIPQSFTFTTAHGVAGTGSFFGANGEARSQPASWNGNFADGDALIWTDYNGAAITLNFASAYTQIGMQIMSDYFGQFYAQICDSTSCFTEIGVSASTHDDTAIYLGISSTTPINSVTVLMLAAPYNDSDYAINQVTLVGDAVSTTPEPSSLALLGTGLLGAMGMVRRRISRS